MEPNRFRTGIGFGFGGSSSRGLFGIGTGSGYTEYEEETLIIDFFDAGNAGLVWRGSGTRRMSKNAKPEQMAIIVKETVDKILAQFPPGTDEKK